MGHTQHNTKNTRDIVTRIKMIEDDVTASSLSNAQVKNTASFKFVDTNGVPILEADRTAVGLAVPSFPVVFGPVRTVDMFSTTSTTFSTILETTFTMWNPNLVVGGYAAVDSGSIGVLRVIQSLNNGTDVIKLEAQKDIQNTAPQRWTVDFGSLTNGKAGGIVTVAVQLMRSSGAGNVYVSVTETRTNSDLIEEELI